MAKKETVPVAERAVILRINRRLAGDGQRLMAARGQRTRQELGDFYIIDTGRKGIVRKRVDLATLARELEALHPWEHIEEPK